MFFAREGTDVAIVYLEEQHDADVTKHTVERYAYFNMTRAAMSHLAAGVILNAGSVTGINGSNHCSTTR